MGKLGWFMSLTLTVTFPPREGEPAGTMKHEANDHNPHTGERTAGQTQLRIDLNVIQTNTRHNGSPNIAVLIIQVFWTISSHLYHFFITPQVSGHKMASNIEHFITLL